MKKQLFVGVILLQFSFGLPFVIGKRNSKWYRAIEKTARDAERIGQATVKYFIPGTIKMGINGMRPLRRRRQISKRQAMYNPLITNYYQSQYPYQYVAPFNSGMMYPRSRVFTPPSMQSQQTNALYQNALMSMYNWNPMVNQDRRGSIPAPFQTPEFKRDKVDPEERKAALESLKNFRRIVAEVKDAIVSIDSDGKMALNENFDSGAKSSLVSNLSAQKKSGLIKKEKTKVARGKKREEIKKKDQKSKKNKIKEQIAKYFTDFVCGDYC